MTAFERSAGVIVFRLEKGRRMYLLLDYGRFWDYPKGHVEKGEDDLTAALRELVEETGIEDVELMDGFRHEISYFFRSKERGLIRKSVVFFLAETSEKKIAISHEHAGYEWLSFEDAVVRATYKGAKETLREAERFLVGSEQKSAKLKS